MTVWASRKRASPNTPMIGDVDGSATTAPPRSRSAAGCPALQYVRRPSRRSRTPKNAVANNSGPDPRRSMRFAIPMTPAALLRFSMACARIVLFTSIVNVAAREPLARDVADGDAKEVVVDLEEVVEIAADACRVYRRAVVVSELHTGNHRRQSQKGILKRLGHGALGLVEAAVLERPRDKRRCFAEEVDLGWAEPVRVAVVVHEQACIDPASPDERRDHHRTDVPRLLQCPVDSRVDGAVVDYHDPSGRERTVGIRYAHHGDRHAEDLFGTCSRDTAAPTRRARSGRSSPTRRSAPGR